MKYQIIPVTAFQQNCSLIWCEQSHKAALIDPGGDIDKLLRTVEQQGVELEKILLTHGHIDHVGGAKSLADQLNIPILGPHINDEFWLDALPQQAKMFNFTYAAAFKPTQWLTEKDNVSVGDVEFSVRLCPGHTPGHIIFFHAKSKTAFVGDVLFKESIGRTDFPHGDHAMLINSIKKQLLPLGDDVSFVPGHGPTSTFGHERRFNPFLTS
ncbi:MAG TPA: MBL fold metallo-hydrolase [Gammaproteobacteria bacterium]|nr:MBL fold metallo-hydrolase [Gammaproteobacteria bacterium]